MRKVITADELADIDRQLDVVRAAVTARHHSWTQLALDLADRLRQALEDDPRHIIEFRATSWTMQHPLACRPNLFACPVNFAAEAQSGPPVAPGRYECEVSGDALLVGDRVGDGA